MHIACWNIRTLLDSVGTNRPERRSALVAHKLSRLNIDIAALSEVRFPEDGSLNERGAGYTLYWSGKPKGERRLAGVGFMMKDSIARKLDQEPTGQGDRIMSMRLPLLNKQHATLFSVYAPTPLANPADKDRFYSDLRNLLQGVPPSDKVIILGDFNARVGRDAQVWKGILGNHGVGNCNDNGRLLLEFCAEQKLTITNTIFQQKNSHKTTWMHPRSKHWHLIDYVLVKQRDVADVFHTRVMPSAECHTDHRLVRCKVNFTFKPQQRTRQAPPRKLQVNLLRNQAVKEKFQSTLNVKLVAGEHTANQDPEAQWEQLKSTVLQTAEDTLGFSSRKHQDWFDENDQEIQKLLKEKRSAHQTYLANPSCPQRKAAFRRACSTLQCKLRVMQDTWWSDLAQKTQMYADQGDYCYIRMFSLTFFVNGIAHLNCSGLPACLRKLLLLNSFCSLDGRAHMASFLNSFLY